MKNTLLALTAASAILASAGSAFAFVDTATVTGVDHQKGTISLSNGRVLNSASGGFGIPADLAPGAKATVVYDEAGSYSQSNIDTVLFRG